MIERINHTTASEGDVPKNSSVSEGGSSGEDLYIVPVSMAKHVYQKTLLEILKTRDYLSREETYRSSLALPSWIRTVILILASKTSRSQSFILRKMIEHGFQIIQHKYKAALDESEKHRLSLLYCENLLIRKIALDFRFGLERGTDFVKMSMELDKDMSGGIVTMASQLKIELASFQRLCIAYSIATIPEEELPSNEPLEISKNAIEDFEKSLADLMEVLKLHADYYNE